MIQKVWRIFDKKSGRYVPAPRNSTGTYATERGAKSGLTQLTKWGARRATGEGFTQDDYEIIPCYLIRASEVEFEAEDGE